MKIQPYAYLVSITLLTGCIPASDVIHRTRPVKRQVAQQTSPEAPHLKRLKNGHYKVRKPWTVTVGGDCWQIPAGYSSNGITAPARIKGSLGDGINHPETWAAVFHDWLFTQKGMTRKEADKIFRRLLIDYGVPTRKANLMYTFVSAYSITKDFSPHRTQLD